MIKEECCTCTDRLNYVKLCEKYDQLESVHEVLVEDNLTYEKQISDLEAKLAEMTEKYNACQEARKHEIEFSRQDKEELKQQLFESGLKTLEEIKLSEQRKKMLEDLSTKNWELEQQLAEKDKEIEKLLVSK